MMPMDRLHIGVLGSGSGSNMQSLLDAIATRWLSATMACVITDVPDALILKMIAARLDAGPKTARYMFDGFPRTMDQAKGLEEIFAQRNGKIVKVLLFDVAREVVVDRIAGRRLCKQCGAVYHVRNIPPKKEGVCDQCGGALYQRADDNEATVLNRLDVFLKQTSGLIQHYSSLGVLAKINAGQHRDKALADILAALPGAA